MKLKLDRKLILVTVVSVIFVISRLIFPTETNSANLKQTKDVLQSSRLSYAARVGVGTSVGSSMVYINTSASAPFFSVSSSNLRAGDSLNIGGTAGYTVVDVVDTDQITVTPVVGANASAGAAIYLINRPQHVVTFKTASAIPNGKFTVLIPADDTNFNDGYPDDGGFDFGGLGDTAVGTSVGVGTSATGYTFDTAVARLAGSTGCTSPANYHCYEFSYTGTGGTNTDITLTIGTTGVGNSAPIAPAPANDTEALAENQTVQVIQYDSGGGAIDQTNVRIALVESVRVTATVDPTLTFTIAGVAAGTTVCGVPATIANNATPLSVPFGTMGLNSFKTLANTLTVSTNAYYGYSVTAIENDQLGKDGDTAPYIADTSCDAGPCTDTSQQDWATATNNGFGYSLDIVGTGGTTPFEWGTAGQFYARQFAVANESESPVEIFSNTTKADSDDVYVCYRLSVGSTQEAGDYENMITYTATASF